MPTVHISRTHHLSHEKARKQVERLAEELHRQLDADYHWEGDTLRFSRSGASGYVALRSSSVEVEVKLSMLLSPFKSKVEQAVSEYLDDGLV